jgi:hypothetical protein
VIRLLIVAALLAKAPRFLGPPVKADAGVPDAGESHGQADPPARDLCASANDIIHSAPAAFERVRGQNKTEKGNSVVWSDPVEVPGGDQCKVIEFKDHSPPFYVCDMAAASCAEGEKKFDEATRQLAACFGAEPKQSDDGKKKTARFHPHAIPVRLTFARGHTCDFRFFIEPLP